MVMVMMMVMFFALWWDSPHLRSQKAADPTQMASNMPEWNQAHRAHHQTMHGGIIANSFAHCDVRTIFFKQERNINQRTEHPIKRAPPFPKLVLRSSASKYMFVATCLKLDGHHSVRPDALIH